MFHALATRTGGHVCLVLSPNQEIKVFAGGVQAFVFAHGRWRVLDPESKFALWEGAVANPRLARVLFQTALDLAEERQGGLLVVVSDPARAIGRLIAPHDVLEFELDLDPQPGSTALPDANDRESPARPFSLFGLTTRPETSPGEAAPADPVDIPIPALVEPLSKRSVHYLARGGSVTKLDAAVLEALAGLDGALVADSNGRLLAFGAILATMRTPSPAAISHRPPPSPKAPAPPPPSSPAASAPSSRSAKTASSRASSTGRERGICDGERGGKPVVCLCFAN